MGRQLLMFLGTLAVLLIIRAPILTMPVTRDQSAITFEAHFLAQSGFDYEALWRGPHADFGGFRAYMTGILPTVLAALEVMGVDQVVSLVFLFHVFVLACMSLLICCAIDLLRPRLSSVRVALVVVWLATIPVVITQADMTGAEVPAASMIVFSLLLLDRGYVKAAVFAGLGAFFLKNSAVVYSTALAAGLGWDFLFRPAFAERKTLLRRGGLLAFSVVVVVLELAIVSASGAMTTRISVTEGVPASLKLWLLALCCPDAIAAVALSVLSLIRFVRWYVYLPESTPPTERSEAYSELLLAVVMSAMLVATIPALSVVMFHPRYLTSVLVINALLIGLTFYRWANPWMANIILVCFIGWNVINWNGLLLPTLPAEFQRVDTFLERSHEYLGHQRSVMNAMHALEKASSESPVVLNEFYFRQGTITTLGYVNEPLHGYHTLPVDYPYLKSVFDVLVDRPDSILVLSVGDSFRIDGEFIFPPPSPGDEVLFRDEFDVPMWVYRKRFGNPGDSRSYEDWLLSLCSIEDGGVAAGQRLMGAGRPDLAVRLLERARSKQIRSPASDALLREAKEATRRMSNP